MMGHLSKPKFTSHKTDEHEVPWGNGAFANPWVTDVALQEQFRFWANDLLHSIEDIQETVVPRRDEEFPWHRFALLGAIITLGVAAEYTVVLDGTTTSDPWPGTYDMTSTIDNVTDNTGNATIGTHMIMKNATWTSNIWYWSFTVKESDTNITTVYNFVINKNIANKTFDYHVKIGGNIEWVNGTWDANGVLDKMSYLIITGGVPPLAAGVSRCVARPASGRSCAPVPRTCARFRAGAFFFGQGH